PDRVPAEVPVAECTPRPRIGRPSDLRQVEGREPQRPSADPDAFGVDAHDGAPVPGDVDEPRDQRDRYDDEPEREEGDHRDHREPPPGPPAGTEPLLEEDRGLPGRHRRATMRAEPPRAREDAGDPMKKIIILLILIAVGVAVAKKVRDA